MYLVTALSSESFLFALYSIACSPALRRCRAAQPDSVQDPHVAVPRQHKPPNDLRVAVGGPPECLVAAIVIFGSFQLASDSAHPEQ